jgi:hypothetical protein
MTGESIQIAKISEPEIQIGDDIDALRILCQRTMKVAVPMPTLSKRDDRYGTYLLLFVERLRSHLSKVLSISPAKESWLIARSSMEGAALIKWMSEDPGNNSENFRILSWKSLYNHCLRNAEDIGVPLVDQSLFKLIEHELLKSGILSPAELNSFKNRQPLTVRMPKSLVNDTPRNFLVSSFTAYDTAVYWDHFTEFHHWNPRTLEGLVMLDSSVRYSEKDDEAGARPIEASLLSLLTGLRSLNEYFKLDLDSTLTELQQEFEVGRKNTPLWLY